MKPNFQSHPNETVSAAIIRLHRHIRRLKADYKPQSLYAAKIGYKRAKTKLRLVK